MWASIPLGLGRHSGDVGSWSCEAGQSETAPRVAASGSGWIRLLPLLLHPHHFRAKRFPVAFRYPWLAHFPDDVGEVL